jgi:hypothetical protein
MGGLERAVDDVVFFRKCNLRSTKSVQRVLDCARLNIFLLNNP